MTEDRRGLLTDREREILRTDGADVSEKYYGVVVSRARKKIERLTDDLPALETHETLADELRAAVCPPSAVSDTETPDDPESQLKRLSNDLAEPITVGATVYEDGDAHPLDTSETTESTVESAPESVEAAIDGLDLPGSGPKLDARRDAVRAAVAYLREQGTAKPADFQRDVYPDHPAHHTEGENPRRAWWKRTVYNGFKQLAESTDAVEPADTTGVWRWTGDE